MPSVYDILQGLTGMQQDAQANVPVIPRNGNPQGANNMPAAAQAPVVPAANNYSWLNPSPFMDQVQQLLARPIMAGYQGPTPGTQEFRDARAAGETPIRDYMQQQRAGTGGPVLPVPGNTGVVGPMPLSAPHTMAPPVSPILPQRRRDTNPIIVR